MSGKKGPPPDQARLAALAIGAKRYHRGQPCPKHPKHTERWVSNRCCTLCIREQNTSTYRARHEKRFAVLRHLWDINNPEKAMLQRSRRRAKQLGITFALTVKDIHIPLYCPVLGILLIRRGNPDHAPSLDRIDNRLGYTLTNVVVISKRANRIKSDSSLDELQKVVKFYGAISQDHSGLDLKRGLSLDDNGNYTA
jgi:hypothetical protein